MLVPALAAFCGASSLIAALLFYGRRRRRLAEAVPARLHAVGLEEREGDEMDVYHHVVFEVLDGPFAGRRMVSELGHGRPPRLPDGPSVELIHAASGAVLTRAALKVEMVLIAVFGLSGLLALGVAFHLYSRS